MAKHFLDRPQIRAALEQMRGEGMPQGMRRHVLFYSCALDVFPKNLPRAHTREWFAARVEKQHALPMALLEAWTQLAHVRRERGDCMPPDRHESLFAAFAKHSNEAVVEHHVTKADGD